MIDLQKLANEIQAEKPFPAASDEYAAGYAAGRYDAWLKVQEAADAFDADEQVRKMVSRFLGWKLPTDFSPDAGISFKAEFNEHADHPMKHQPTGTNLLTADQARGMVEFMLSKA